MGSLRDVEQVREQDAVLLPFLVAGPLAKDLLPPVLYILGMSRAMVEPATFHTSDRHFYHGIIAVINRGVITGDLQKVLC